MDAVQNSYLVFDAGLGDVQDVYIAHVPEIIEVVPALDFMGLLVALPGGCLLAGVGYVDIDLPVGMKAAEGQDR